MVRSVPAFRLQLFVDREVREQHHRLLSESLHHDEPQLLVPPRQFHRHDAEVYLAMRLPAVRIEADDGLVIHDALSGEPGVGLRGLPAPQVPFVHACDELPPVVKVIVVERGSVPSAVIDAYPFSVSGLVYLAQDVQDLLVFAFVAFGVRRPQL